MKPKRDPKTEGGEMSAPRRIRTACIFKERRKRGTPLVVRSLVVTNWGWGSSNSFRKGEKEKL